VTKLSNPHFCPKEGKAKHLILIRTQAEVWGVRDTVSYRLLEKRRSATCKLPCFEQCGKAIPQQKEVVNVAFNNIVLQHFSCVEKRRPIPFSSSIRWSCHVFLFF
jgi:hypothetical protein